MCSSIDSPTTWQDYLAQALGTMLSDVTKRERGSLYIIVSAGSFTGPSSAVVQQLSDEVNTYAQLIGNVANTARTLENATDEFDRDMKGVFDYRNALSACLRTRTTVYCNLRRRYCTCRRLASDHETRTGSHHNYLTLQTTNTQADSAIEMWSNKLELDRWAITPPVIQHVGARSTKDMSPDSAAVMSTAAAVGAARLWNYQFEMRKPGVNLRIPIDHSTNSNLRLSVTRIVKSP
ncbi:hypothetical protein MRB53_039164 [Persea americana]|nr:hypothetical protein MRB53_039164 [Persea americana]